MKKYFLLLLLFFKSAQGISQDTTGNVIILSNKVGPTINLDERNIYRLFMSIPNFESAVLLQKPDSTFTLKVLIRVINDSSKTIQWFPFTKEEVQRIRDHIETFNGIQDQKFSIPDSIEKKSTEQLFELSVCVPVTEEPAVIFRISYSYGIIGVEPSLIADTFGAYVLSANIVFSFPFIFKDLKFKPFGTIGYGCFLPFDEEMVNFGCGINCRFFKSLGVRLEYIVFTTWEAGYYGPSVGISYYIKI